MALAGSCRISIWRTDMGVIFPPGARREQGTMATGTVKVWSRSRGSGWIMPENGGDRVYVHKSGVERSDVERAPSLEVGQRVEYQIGQRPKGSAAINVRPVTEQPETPVAGEATE